MIQPHSHNHPQPNSKDYHVRAWMMAYLPEKEGPRDLVMCVGGDVLSVTLSQIAFYFDWNVLGFVMN